MSLVVINKNPSPRELTLVRADRRRFWRTGQRVAVRQVPVAGRGLDSVGAATLSGGRLLRCSRDAAADLRGWMYAFLPLGMVMSFLLLAVIYFLVFTPLGLVMRLVGRDAGPAAVRPNRRRLIG